jgi:predicted nucleic acid-binding protein
LSVVVDASVACKWFFEEERHEDADRILAEETLIAPELIYMDVGNVVWKRVKNGTLEKSKSQAIVTQLLTVPFRIADARVLLPHALEISLEHGRTVYDSMYVALAMAHGCKMVTADERLVNSFAGTELASVVRLL